MTASVKIKKAGRILVLIMVGLLQLPLMAQFPFIQKIRVAIPAGEPVFRKAIQDKNGYLWLGSDQGLFRYDGNTFKPFYPPADSINFQISALHEDKDGVLWIGCKNGKIYRHVQGVISLFDPEEGTAGQAVSDIVTDADGRLWWSTTGEGIYFYEKGRVFNLNHADPSGLPDDYVYDLEITQNGELWAGTDAGIALCTVETSGKVAVPLPSHIDLPDIMVRVIKEDQDGRLWLGFQDGGTGYLDAARGHFSQTCPGNAWPYGPVQDIQILPDQTWVATAQGDVIEIEPEKQSGSCRLVMLGESEFGKINDLLEDREGNVWILANSGFYRTTGTRMKFLKQAGGKPIDNVHSLRNDSTDPELLWFSNDEGLFRLNLTDGITKKYLEDFRLPDLKVTCIYQDKQRFIWAGTFNYGVFRIRPEDGSWIRITEEQGLVNNNVLSISGHDDTLWMATLGGASEVILSGNSANDPFRITSHNRESGLVSNFIYSVYEDTHDQIWFGTDGDGISVLTKEGWINFDERDGLTDDVIYSITGDKNGNIWIASATDGLFKFADEKFTHYGIEDGLTSLDITGITTVDDEVLVVQDNGLDILHIPTGRIAHYGEEIGLSGISPDLNVISKDPEGNVWIGTRTGLIRYQHGTANSSYGPQTVLEEMSVYLEPRVIENDLVLSFKDNHVSFKYAGIWYSNPQGVSYQIMLEGYDLGWKDTYDRQITYSSLQYGKYTFKVRSSLDKSFRNAPEVSFQFRIREPFWLKDWFIILLLIFISGLIYLFIGYREDRFRRIERTKKEKVEFEFQVLKNQVNPHFLFNSFSTLMSLIEDQPEQALKYTEKLSDFFRIILQFKDQEVISLSEELSLIESYFFLLKKRFGDNLNLKITLEENLKKTFIPPMTLQILIENAVKHNIISKDKPLFINIYEDKGKIVVENNLQPKLTAEVSTGIGLENIRKRYKLITKDEPVIEKMEDLFRVKLPVIRGH